ncbi:hypothetical protein BC833DRAFT_606984 [Globomyces pollinis-pini]|nr:hypothetical protein BC833DRAFT_606984 [Globomyces pollinis-pini]
MNIVSNGNSVQQTIDVFSDHVKKEAMKAEKGNPALPTEKEEASHKPPLADIKSMPLKEKYKMQIQKRHRVINRSAMGDYLPDTSEVQHLSSLANPTPGPLSYEIKPQTSGYQYSILGKNHSKIDQPESIGPGPSKYDIRNTTLVFDKTPNWSFGQKTFSDVKPSVFTMNLKKENFPSPLHYNNQDKGFGKDALSCSMSGRHSTTEYVTPGPDRYLPPSEFGKAPKYSFGLRPLAIEDVNPGPLDYNVPSVLPDAPRGPAFTMKKQYESPYDKPNCYPGPDVYYPKLGSSEKAASLKGMHKQTKLMLTPGPANYIIPPTVATGPQISLRARNIPYQDDEYIGPNPGPADYKPNRALTVDAAPQFSLGSRLKERLRDNHFVPGPCAYEPKDRQIKNNQHAKVSLKGRYKVKLESSPGPADYNSHLPASTPTAAQLARNAIHLSTAERLKNVIEDSPGPADYQVCNPSATKTKGPCYTLRKRLDKNKVEQSPGPSAYDASPKDRGSRVSIKSRASPFVLVFPSTRIDTLRVRA